MASEQIIDLRDHRRRRHLPAGRALHLVDLENLAGGSAASTDDIEIALDGYERVVRFGADDHRVVACGKGLVFPAKERWPGADCATPEASTGPTVCCCGPPIRVMSRLASTGSSLPVAITSSPSWSSSSTGAPSRFASSAGRRRCRGGWKPRHRWCGSSRNRVELLWSRRSRREGRLAGDGCLGCGPAVGSSTTTSSAG